MWSPWPEREEPPTSLSELEKETIRTAVRAFCPLDLGLSPDAISERGTRFMEDLIAKETGGVSDLQLLLKVLGAAFLSVDRSDRSAVRRLLTEMDRGTGALAPTTRGLARFAQRLATFLVYAWLDASGKPVAAGALGYEIFPDRPRGATATIPFEPFLPAEIWVRPEDPLRDHTYDVVILGSGSGGAVVARRLVEKHGLDVAVLEIGDYVPESWVADPPTGRRRPLPWDEAQNLLAYYKKAGLQITQGIPMFIFQGECLGGSSVINNAVCFRLPDAVWNRWVNDFGVTWSRSELEAAYDRIRDEVGIGPAPDLVVKDSSGRPYLNPSGEKLRSGAANPEEIRACEVNLSHDPKCLGCGYCNLTCGYLRKRSVLQTMLPAAWESARRGRGKLTVYTGRKATALSGELTRRPFRADGVSVRTRRFPYATGRIKARKVVVAAGAIASSGLLARTAGIRLLGLPIGERFAFNLASPIHAEYEEPVRAWDGLQIAHYYRPDSPDGFVVETWYNAPAAQSLALPGWMDELQQNVSRYAFYACAAPLLGSTAKSRVVPRVFSDAEDVHVRLDTDVDLRRLKDGLRTICRLFFASRPAPTRALIGRLEKWELSPANYEDRIAEISSFDEIQIGSGHPQGGNCLAGRSGQAGGPGVVSPDFRVYGTENVYVADASVFPTSLGVNPHWTVMALADLASERVAES